MDLGHFVSWFLKCFYERVWMIKSKILIEYFHSIIGSSIICFYFVLKNEYKSNVLYQLQTELKKTHRLILILALYKLPQWGKKNNKKGELHTLEYCSTHIHHLILQIFTMIPVKIIKKLIKFESAQLITINNYKGYTHKNILLISKFIRVGIFLEKI